MEDQSPEVIDNPSIDSHRESLANEMLSDLTEMLNQALGSLPEIYHQVLALRYLGGMSNYEIAEFLGISQVAIRQRLSRARAELKEGMLAMMSRTYEQKKLPVSFTFRIVEMVKQIRVQPISMTKGLSLGLSLTAGIIAIVFGIGQHLNLANPLEALTGYTSSSQSKVLKVGEFPVDMLKVSNISVLSNNHGNGDGLGSEIPSLQNALFMSPQAGDTWTRKADMPTKRAWFATAVVNGKIYAIGGGKDFELPPAVEEYNPEKDKWVIKAFMLMGRMGLSASTVNGKIYAIGGQTATFLSLVDEYDPEVDAWKRKTNMPTPRAFFSTCSVNGKIYAIGGFTTVGFDGKYYSTVEEYDPTTDTWVTKADMPTARCGFATCVVNGKIYAIGGTKQGQWFIKDVEEYDPTIDKWTKKSDLLNARVDLAAGSVNGKIYAIGGTGENGVCSTVEEYDPISDKWVIKTDLQIAREALSASAVNGKIYAIGGQGKRSPGVDWNIVPTVEEYSPEVEKSVNFKGKLPTTWGEMRTAMKR
jgi:N-acetylneuraminic acid mutarotase